MMWSSLGQSEDKEKPHIAEPVIKIKTQRKQVRFTLTGNFEGFQALVKKGFVYLIKRQPPFGYLWLNAKFAARSRLSAFARVTLERGFLQFEFSLQISAPPARPMKSKKKDEKKM